MRHLQYIAIVSIFLIVAIRVQAQPFFYIAADKAGEKPLREAFLRASQFVVSSPLASDYSIRAGWAIQANGREATLRLQLQDTLSAQIIFQTQETYPLAGLQRGFVQYFALRTFIAKNIGQLILTANQDRHRSFSKMVIARKDKT